MAVNVKSRSAWCKSRKTPKKNLTPQRLKVAMRVCHSLCVPILITLQSWLDMLMTSIDCEQTCEKYLKGELLKVNPRVSFPQSLCLPNALLADSMIDVRPTSLTTSVVVMCW